MDTNSQKLIEVFDMLNERLYAIEKSNNQTKQHLKNKCIKAGELDKDLFEYPLDVNIIDMHLSIDKQYFVYVTLSIYDAYDCSIFSLCDIEDYNKVKESLPDVLNEEQINVVEAYYKKYHLLDNYDIEYIKCKEIQCQEIGVISIFKSIDEHILNEYLKLKHRNLHLLCPTIVEYYEMILKNVESIDETIQCVQDIYNFFGFHLDKLSTKNKINITLCPDNYWVGFEILLNIPEVSCNTEVLLKVYKINTKIIKQYIAYCYRLDIEGYIKYHNALDDKHAVQLSINIFNDIIKKHFP